MEGNSGINEQWHEDNPNLLANSNLLHVQSKQGCIKMTAYRHFVTGCLNTQLPGRQLNCLINLFITLHLML